MRVIRALSALVAIGTLLPANASAQTLPSWLEEVLTIYARVKASTTIPDMPGTGPFAAKYDMALGREYVVYEPKNLTTASAVRKLGVYAWANGGCSYDGTSRRFHLLEIASHGYVVVVPGVMKSGPRGSLGPGNVELPPAPGEVRTTQTPDMLREAIDWILAENLRPESPYFNKINPSKIAVSGSSCGGTIALNVGLDSRIKAVTLHNSGVFGFALPGAPVFATKQDLASLHTPILYVTGGPTDIARAAALDDFNRINHVPVFLADRPGAGHLGMSLEPNGEGTKIELHWLEWQLFGNWKAAGMFASWGCTLCWDIKWQIYRKGM